MFGLSMITRTKWLYLEADQYQILSKIRKLSLNRKYKNLMAWDLSLSLDREGGRWNYDVQIEPQDEDDQPELESMGRKLSQKVSI